MTKESWILKKIRKEIYKREEKFFVSIYGRDPKETTIRAVALYRLEGLLSEIERELKDKKQV